MAEQVTILGDGAMATVCSILLDAGGHGVTMWGAFESSIERLLQSRQNPNLLPEVRIPPEVRLTASDTDCFDGATVIVSAIPTQHVRSVWRRLEPRVPAGAPIISVSKGIENGTLLRPTQVIADVMLARWTQQQVRPSLGALSGPNIAAELARYLPATAVAASEDPELARRIQTIFTTPWFRIYTNDDVTGVELAGAIKNVIALAAGILDGLGAGSNAKAALLARGLVEITRLGVAMGARESTFQGLAGLGDLITTCISPEGRNRSVGEQIGKGRPLDKILEQMDAVAEGVPTTQSVLQLSARHHVEMPITQAVHSVLFEGRDALAALTDLMSRQPKAE